MQWGDIRRKHSLLPYGIVLAALALLLVVGIFSSGVIDLRFGGSASPAVVQEQGIDGPVAPNVQVSEVDLLTADIATDPSNPQLFWDRGHKLMMQGFVDKDRSMVSQAIVDLERAIARDPENGWAYLDEGLAYTYLGQHDQASAAFADARAHKISQGEIMRRVSQVESYPK